jgi:DNA-binding CsgD family transcriptional regulator
LFGRESQLARVEALVDAMPIGGALLVRGEPGIGKSSILEAAQTRAWERGMLMLAATAVPSEAALPFAGLHQIVRPIIAGVDALPPPQQVALMAAFGMIDSRAPDLFVTALATLNLLAEAADRAGGMLVTVDDAHWLDEPTSKVLAFVARRIASDPIAILAAIRAGDESPLAEIGIPNVDLNPLNEHDAARLVDAVAPHLQPAARKRVLHEAAGNPLAIVELPVALASLTSAEQSDIPGQLPLTARLERAFTARHRELPSATQSLLTVAAIDDAGSIAELLAAATSLEGNDVTAEELAPAIAAGLVAAVDTIVRFRHPLIRSAVYQDAGVAGRRAAHLALADVLSDDPDRSAWHRAAAALGPDPDVAAGLEAAASRARRRGAIAVAVAALERAATLTADPPLRGTRLVRAADLAFELGRRDIVTRTLREADTSTLGSLDRARLIWIREQTDPHVVTDPAGVTYLIDLADRTRADGDNDLAVGLLWLVAQRCWWADPGKETRDLVIAAAERTGLSADDPQLIAIFGYAAPIERGQFVTDWLAKAGSMATGDPTAGRLLGNVALAVGSFDLGLGFLAEANGTLRAQGRLGHLARVLTLQAWGATLLGDWKLAAPAADEAAALASETGDAIWVAGAHAVSATLAAYRGREDQADDLSAEAERIAGPLRASFVLAVVQLARGVSALGGGRPSEAFEQLRRVFDGSDPAFHHAVRTWAVGDFAEAAVQSGHSDAAELVLGEMERLSEETPASWLHAGVRYARALLAPDDMAEAVFQAALDDDTPYPIQRARLLLAYGVWLRRQRRVAESRSPLRAARDAFDSIGVIPWAERARRELRASGEVSRKRASSSWEELTPQELQIAQLAADGLSNRDIGERLFLSHRTVGSHLYRIFPKLAITSRGALHGALAAAPSLTASATLR